MKRILAACLLAVFLQAFGDGPALAQAVGPCSYKFGFKALYDQIPNVVGSCGENEHFEPSTGNTLQKTSGGLLVWRQADNWTAFTNGSTTWILGPYGLVRRPNAGPLFDWEAAAVAQTAPRVAAPALGPPLVTSFATLTDARGRQLGAFVRSIVDDLDLYWDGVFRTSGRAYHGPRAVWLEGHVVASACGYGPTNSPMYCVPDESLYLPGPYFAEFWQRNLDTPVAVIMAHEWGHHIQHLFGLSPARLSSEIRFELQADCLSGVFIGYANSRGWLEPGDLAEALATPLDAGSQGHGTGEQRLRAFLWGYNGASCGEL